MDGYYSQVHNASLSKILVFFGGDSIPNWIFTKKHNLWLNTYWCPNEKNIYGELPESSILSILLIKILTLFQLRL